jgi:hypothetical protein
MKSNIKIGFTNQQITNRIQGLATCFHACFLLGLFFVPEDGDDILL